MNSPASCMLDGKFWKAFCMLFRRLQQYQDPLTHCSDLLQPYIVFFFSPVSPSYPTSVSWDHLPNTPPVPSSLRTCFWRNSNSNNGFLKTYVHCTQIKKYHIFSKIYFITVKMFPLPFPMTSDHQGFPTFPIFVPKFRQIFKGAGKVHYINGIYSTQRYNVKIHSCCVFSLHRYILFLDPL